MYEDEFFQQPPVFQFRAEQPQQPFRFPPPPPPIRPQARQPWPVPQRPPYLRRRRPGQ